MWAVNACKANDLRGGGGGRGVAGLCSLARPGVVPCGAVPVALLPGGEAAVLHPVHTTPVCVPSCCAWLCCGWRLSCDNGGSYQSRITVCYRRCSAAVMQGGFALYSGPSRTATAFVLLPRQMVAVERRRAARHAPAAAPRSCRAADVPTVSTCTPCTHPTLGVARTLRSPMCTTSEGRGGGRDDAELRAGRVSDVYLRNVLYHA